MPEAAPSQRSGSVLRPGYFERAMQPLTVLIFLLPFVILYEIGTILYFSDADGRLAETVAAYRILSRFFEFFGAFGLYLPGLALVTVLLIQHAISKERHGVRPSVLGLMCAETVVLTTPLLLLALLLGGYAAVGLAPNPAGASSGAGGLPPGLASLPVPARVTVAVGAGLYEELLFRMVLFAIVSALAVDLAGLSDRVAKVAAVLISAFAFAFYHDVSSPTGGTDIWLLLFLILAGLYFGVLYLTRGFGIVVAVHALYDIIALVLLAPGNSEPG